MSENLNYILDEELERLIAQVEQEELVAAPPDLMEHILEAESKIYSEAVGGYSEEAECVLTARTITVDAVVEREPKVLLTAKPVAARKKEFYAYCFRVITSVAAAVALVFLLPELTERMNLSGMPSQGHSDKSMIVQEKSGSENANLSLWNKNEESEGNASKDRWQTAGNTIPSKAEVTEGNITPSKAEVVEGDTTPNKTEIAEGKTVPSKSEITAGEVVPSKAEIVDGKPVPSKETVLQDTGFIEKVINSTGWFNKESDTQ